MANVYMGKDVEDFIFNENANYEDSHVEESVTDEEINVYGVIECVDDPEVGCYRIALENEQNYNKIINACMMQEFSVLESTGEEMVYEAGQIKKFFGWIKTQIQKFWSKVMGVFKKVQDFISQLIMSNKAFVKKYKGHVIKKPENAKEFKGYKMDLKTIGNHDFYGEIAEYVKGLVAIDAIAKTSKEDADNIAEEFRKGFEEDKKNMRFKACGKKVDESEYSKQLKIWFFGSSEKVSLPYKSFTELISELEKADSAKAAVKNAFNNAKASVKYMMNLVKNAEKNSIAAEGRKDNHVMKVAKCFTDALNAGITIMSKAMSVQTSAITTLARQDRSMAAYYVANNPDKESFKKTEELIEKNKPKNEGFVFDEDDFII